jgi:ribosomal subunit interface protein
MEVKISARNLTVSTRFNDYVEERAHKIEQFVHKAQEFSIKVTRHDHSRVTGPEDQVELTVFGSGQIIRAEAHAADKFAAFDVAFGKLTERLRRASDKRKVHHGRHGSIGASELSASDFASLDVHPVDADVLLGISHESSEPEEAEIQPHTPIVIRRKDFEGHRLTVSDALDNMELLGHDFYLFIDAETDKPSVVYKRKGWNYGVIALN